MPADDWQLLVPHAMKSWPMPCDEDELDQEVGVLSEFVRQLLVLESSRERPAKERQYIPENEPRLKDVVDAIDDHPEFLKSMHGLPDDFDETGLPWSERNPYSILLGQMQSDLDGGEFNRNAWRKRFAHLAQVSTGDAELAYCREKGCGPRTKRALRQARKAVLMSAALANRHESIEAWTRHRRTAARNLAAGRSRGGTERNRYLDSYHRKVESLARRYLKKHPSASPGDVAAGILEGVLDWIDESDSAPADLMPTRHTLLRRIEDTWKAIASGE